MKSFTAALIGTTLLILLGDGVVAAVVLDKSEAQNSGWMVITRGWAMAVAVAVYAVGRASGAYCSSGILCGGAAGSRGLEAEEPEKTGRANSTRVMKFI
jgi:glycerol uptake facilitator protein